MEIEWKKVEETMLKHKSERLAEVKAINYKLFE